MNPRTAARTCSAVAGVALTGALLLATATAADTPARGGTTSNSAATAPKPTRSEADCAARVEQGRERETRIPGHLAIYRVVGKGRANFYSAPDADCALVGVFVIPGDEVIAYAERDGYTFVMYLNHARGTDTTGWLESARVAGTGLGISPE